MKFSVSSSDLQNALKQVGRAVPSKTTLPVLKAVLFEKTGSDEVSLSATDLEVSARKKLAVTFDEETPRSSAPSRCAIPARQLTKTLKALPDIPLTLEVSEDLEVILETDQGRYQMVGHDGGDFPEIDALDEGEEKTLRFRCAPNSKRRCSNGSSKRRLLP